MEAHEATVPKRAEVEYVTRNFSSLQGLRILPVAVVFAVWATSEAQWLTGTAWWVSFFASLAVAVAAIPLVDRWYARRFGSVEPRRRTSLSLRMTVAVLGVVVTAVVVVAVGAMGWWPEVEQVALSGIVLGVAVTVFAWVQGPVGRRVHPWVHRYGVAVAVVSVAPLGMLTGEGAHPLTAPGAMAGVITGFFVVSALDTHRALGVLLPGVRDAA